MQAGGRFTTAAANAFVCSAMNELRELRRAIGLGQCEFAGLLSIPLETFRPWDSGRRVVSIARREGYFFTSGYQFRKNVFGVEVSRGAFDCCRMLRDRGRPSRQCPVWHQGTRAV